MSPSKPDLLHLTRRALATLPGGSLCVAVSGGGDSSALLDVLAQLPEARERGLRAVHVDHGLNPCSGEWASRCRQFCTERQIDLDVLKVVVAASGQGPEAAAREARLAALQQHLRDGEALLLAHHRDDQVETVLLKLLRGAGPHGLAGMQARRPFGLGWLWRPWLDVPHAAIADWLERQSIVPVADPANADPGMTRSWLRRQILPQIRGHLPQADASILQSAQHCAETRNFLDQQLDSLGPLIGTDDSLDAAAWLDLPAALRGLLLERWLHRKGLPAPTSAQRHELERQAATASEDRVPLLHWPGVDVRVWRGHMHAMAPLPEMPAHWQQAWDGRAMRLPLGTLALVPSRAPADKPPPHFTVRLRRGGEYLHPAGDRCGRELRYIFQQHGLPPWLRPFCPLLYHGEELLAVADLCLTETGTKCFEALGVRPEWRYHV